MPPVGFMAVDRIWTHRSICDCVTGVIDSNPPGRQGFVRWMRNDVCGIGEPLLNLVDEGYIEILMPWKSVNRTLSDYL